MMRFATIFGVLGLAFLSTGCAHKVDVGYLQAADVTIPQDVQTVLVIDRSRPRNFGEHLATGAEGAMTGETFMLDAESAAFAIETLELQLGDAPRFEVVDFQVNGRRVDTSAWDRQLAAAKVRQLCRQARCDAVIALETFDSDQITEVEREFDPYTETERQAAIDSGDCEDRRCAGDHTFHTTQTTDVEATFRMYDGRTGRVLDEHTVVFLDSDTGFDGEDVEAALADLDFEGTVFTGAHVAGAEYAFRVSPHEVLAARKIFGTGSPEMRHARKAAKRGDLRTAEQIWSEVAANSTGTAKAKALHNLAVAAEARGNPGKALRLAQRANRIAGKNRTADYVGILHARIANDARVAEQLGTEPFATR